MPLHPDVYLEGDTEVDSALYLQFVHNCICLSVFGSAWICSRLGSYILSVVVISGGFRGGSGGSLEPPLGPNYFNFMGKFMKNQAKC